MKAVKNRTGNRTGFTLVEMLVATAIMSMMFTAAVSGFPAARNAYYKQTDVDNANVLLSTTLTMIRDALDKTEIVMLDNSDPDSPGQVISFYAKGKGWRAIANPEILTDASGNTRVDTKEGLQLVTFYSDPDYSETGGTYPYIYNSLLPAGAAGATDGRRITTLYAKLDAPITYANGIFTVSLAVMKQPKEGGNNEEQIVAPKDYKFYCMNNVEER